MKNKRIGILLGVVILALTVGCGKDEKIIEDNTVSEGQILNLGSLSDTTPGNESDNTVGSMSDNVAGDVSDNMAGSVSDNIVGDVSANITGSISDNMSDGVSGNETGSMTDETQEVLPDNISEEIIGSMTAGRTNNILIANMSGKDIESLTFTFSTDAGARDILGEEELKDGNLFVYTATDISFLQQTSGLRLKVTAIADDETVMEFPEIRVINIAGSTIVLSRGQSTSENQVGYEAYIQ